MHIRLIHSPPPRVTCCLKSSHQHSCCKNTENKRCSGSHYCLTATRCWLWLVLWWFCPTVKDTGGCPSDRLVTRGSVLFSVQTSELNPRACTYTHSHTYMCRHLLVFSILFQELWAVMTYLTMLSVTIVMRHQQRRWGGKHSSTPPNRDLSLAVRAQHTDQTATILTKTLCFIHVNMAQLTQMYFLLKGCMYLYICISLILDPHPEHFHNADLKERADCRAFCGRVGLFPCLEHFQSPSEGLWTPCGSKL